MNIFTKAKAAATPCRHLFGAAVAAVILTALPTTAQAQMRVNVGDDAPMRKLQMAELAITNLYVDTVNESKLVEDAIRGMLEKLDPHSAYSTPKETKAMNEPLQGSFDGIGVQFNMSEDTLLVIQPVAGGPSEKVGIMAGDRITAVNDSAIAGVKMSTEEIMRRLRGPRGTKVALKIVRRGIADTLTFVVKRDKIPVKTIDAAYMISPGLGYIRIGSFGANTHKEFMERADSLRAAGMNTLVLDLQENGGGYMQAAAEIANEFLDRGDLIVYMEGRAAQRQEYKARGNGRLRNCRVVVIVNEYSASAAEIVTGALQDQDRGTVVGRRTFGKGLVQRPIEFPDGSMMRLTIAHYYTPTGRCIQKPYVSGGQKDYAREIEDRFLHGELYSADSIHFADSLKFYTLKEHRVVYGGGGIMPDYFVPLDTTRYTPFHRKVVARGLVVSANLRYVDNHRKELRRKYTSFDLFNAEYTVPQSVIDDIVAEAAKLDIKPADDDELQRTLPQLRMQIKALVARDIWDMDEYFQVINQTTPSFVKAVEVATSGELAR